MELIQNRVNLTNLPLFEEMSNAFHMYHYEKF